jgi:nucleoid-associated protein EbfC
MTTDGTEGAPAGPSTPDLGALMSQVLQARDAVQSAQQNAAGQVVEGTAGGGLVRIRVTGGLDFQSVTIDPSVIDPADPELLEDLVLAAVRDAAEQASGLQAQALGGFDLGSITGMLGGS